MDYKQWILPLITTSWGAIEIRINPQSKRPYPLAASDGNFDFMQSDATKVLLLAHGTRIFTRGGITPFQKFLARTDGKFTADTRDFVFRDMFTWSGVDGAGTPVSVDERTTAYKSLLNHIFEDPTSLTTFFVSYLTPAQIATYNAASYATKGDNLTLKIVGDCTVSRNTETDFAVLPERSVSSLQMQTLKCRIDAGLSRANVFLVRELIATCGSYIEGPYQFVGGMVPDPSFSTDNLFSPGDIDAAISKWNAFYSGGAFLQFYEHLSFLTFAGGSGNHYTPSGFKVALRNSVCSINDGLHYISRARILERCATLMGMSFDMDDDIVTTEFDFSDRTLEVDAWGTGTIGNIWSDQIAPDAGSNVGQKTGLIYEYAFGSDPRCNLNVAQIKSPTTYDWDGPIAEVIKTLFPDCAPRIFIDQANKRPRLRLISERLLNTVVGSETYILSAITDTATSFAPNAPTSLRGSAATTVISNVLTNFTPPIYVQFGDASTGVEYAEVTGYNQNGSPVPFYTTRIQTGKAWPVNTPVARVRMIPAKARLAPGSQREQTIVSAPHFEVCNTGDSDVYCSPHNRGEGLKSEVRFRAKKLGPLNKNRVQLTDIVPNSALAQNKQADCFGTFTGGLMGRHILGTATVTLTSTTSEQKFYDVVDTSADFSYLVPWSDRNASKHPFSFDHDQVLFTDGTSGGIVSRTDRNTLSIALEIGDPQPPTGAGVVYRIGYTGHLTDVDVTDGSDQADPHTNLYSATDPWGQPYLGQQIVFPTKGVFTISAIDSGTGILTLDKAVNGTASGIEAWTGGPQILSEGWLKGAFLYYVMSASNKVKRFNDDIYIGYSENNDDPTYHLAAQRNFWHSNSSADPDYYLGCYTVSRVEYQWQNDGGTPPTPPDDLHGDSTYSYAQLMAATILGDPVQLTRVYELDNPIGLGETDETGFDVKDSLAEYNYGALRQFIANGIEVDETQTGKTEPMIRYTLQEWPDYSAPLTEPVVKKTGAGSTGGASSGGSSGGGGASSGPSTGTPTTGAVLRFRTDASTGTPTIQDNDIAVKYTAASGVLAPANFTGNTLILINASGSDWTLASGSNFYLQNLGCWTLFYDGSTTVYDSTLPAGWTRSGNSG